MIRKNGRFLRVLHDFFFHCLGRYHFCCQHRDTITVLRRKESEQQRKRYRKSRYFSSPFLQSIFACDSFRRLLTQRLSSCVTSVPSSAAHRHAENTAEICNWRARRRTIISLWRPTELFGGQLNFLKTHVASLQRVVCKHARKQAQR